MNERHANVPPPLPTSLRSLLVDLRRRIWSTKTLEAGFAALAGLLASYLLVFVLDRFVETPGGVRLVLLVAGLVGGVVFLPLQVARWVGGHRSLLQVARRVAREDLRRGDELLGVLELTEDAEEFRRSPVLARAAIEQGEARLSGVDLSHTLPRSRHRGWGAFAGACAVLAILALTLVPAAGRNALARWLLPLGDVERYTFTQLEDYPAHRVVARFEPFVVELALDEHTRRRPERATLTLARGERLTAMREGDRFRFEVEALAAEVEGTLAVGDYRGRLRFEPLDRPEVSAAAASVDLPAYLELPDALHRDVRGGSVGVVEGSAVRLEVTTTRELSSARWAPSGTPGDTVATRVAGAGASTAPLVVDASVDTELTYVDVHGLASTVPFQLALRARPDGRPTVLVDGLAPDTILLHDQAAVFQVIANDDFGVRRVGLEWRGIGELEGNFRRAEGEKLLGTGEPGDARLELTATLHPLMLGIDPQVIELRAWALDALPGRERAYSNPVRVQVMTEDDHMIWLTRALGGWYDEAVEVRDEENNLLKTNEALFELSDAELVAPEVQRKVQSQAAAERANARRLGRLVGDGSELLEEAARNPQFNSNTLDDWAEMMSTLEGIADQRMPSVAALLAEAARAEESRPLEQPLDPPLEERLAEGRAGVNRAQPEPGEAAATPAPALPSDPTVSDVESDFNGPDEAPSGPDDGGAPTPGAPASLGLPDTVVQGGGAPPEAAPAPAPGDAPAPSPTRAELAAAIEAQRALMEEFQAVAGQISEILANLEGSTFVKRLKALSRAETGVAQDLDGALVAAFGAEELPEERGVADLAQRVANTQEASAQRASSVREDLGAYIQRLEDAGRSVETFQQVRTEMGDLNVARELDVVGDLALLSRSGEAIVGAEILADHLDRWAEILVGPGDAGAT